MRSHLGVIMSIIMTLFLGFISCRSVTENSRNDYIGVWRSEHDAGGNILEVYNDDLKYTIRTCTEPDKLLTCKWNLSDGWFVILKENGNERYKMIKRDNIQYLISEIYIKQYPDALPEHVFQNDFKKQ